MEEINEEWRDIKDYEGLYQISNMGNIRSLGNGKSNNSKKQIMKIHKNHKGYFQIGLSKNNIRKSFRVHKLVAQAFIPNPENKPQIDHINTDRTDNRVENLRWVTAKENQNNPITIKNMRLANIGKKNALFDRKGEHHPKSKPILQFSKNGDFIRKWGAAADVERELDITRNQIIYCCK